MNTILTWGIFGILVGAVIHFIDSPTKQGVGEALLLGFAGALTGGFLANLIFSSTLINFDLTSLMIAISGSLIMLFVGRAISRT